MLRAVQGETEEGCALPASASVHASEFAILAVELLSNSYMNAETIRIDSGTRMQPK